jgi:predicted ribosome quality control (RQC) complex YloA/Tae2 family protein
LGNIGKVELFHFHFDVFKRKIDKKGAEYNNGSYPLDKAVTARVFFKRRRFAMKDKKAKKLFKEAKKLVKKIKKHGKEGEALLKEIKKLLEPGKAVAPTKKTMKKQAAKATAPKKSAATPKSETPSAPGSVPLT